MCSQAGVGCGMMTRLFRFVGLKRNKKTIFAMANGTKMKIKNKSTHLTNITKDWKKKGVF
jgi:hypothetical protein